MLPPDALSNEMPPPEGQPAERSGLFPMTRWSLVVAAKEDGPAALRAMGDLLQAYWQPLYIFARRSGLTAEDAQDGVQGFYETLISRHSLQTARQDAGKLRSFLLKAFQNYLRDIYRRGTRAKRGGGLVMALDDVESHVERAAAGNVSPEAAFERDWAFKLMDRTLARLRADYAQRGKAAVFELLEPALAWNGLEMNYSEAAERLSMTVSNVQTAVRRMRIRYRKLLEDEVAQTVDGPESLANELEHLVRIVSGS